MTKNNILVIGSKGQLGTDMMQLLTRNKCTCTGFDFPQIDITNRESVTSILSRVKPDIVINCAAFTAVDDCETKIKEAYSVNAEGPGILAAATYASNALLVHISTDYVFDGRKTSPYIETDTPSPLTIYGKSKLEGELNVSQNTDKFQIYRIAWLYGVFGNNFVKTIRQVALKKSASGESLKVVNDQFGTPTYTLDVCKQIYSTMQKNLFGIFHCTSEGSCSWYDFAREIISSSGITVDLIPCTTKEFPRPAPRPMFSVLENARLKSAGENRMPDWKDAFYSFLNQEKQIENEILTH